MCQPMGEYGGQIQALLSHGFETYRWVVPFRLAKSVCHTATVTLAASVTLAAQVSGWNRDLSRLPPTHAVSGWNRDLSGQRLKQRLVKHFEPCHVIVMHLDLSGHDRLCSLNLIGLLTWIRVGCRHWENVYEFLDESVDECYGVLTLSAQELMWLQTVLYA